MTFDIDTITIEEANKLYKLQLDVTADSLDRYMFEIYKADVKKKSIYLKKQVCRNLSLEDIQLLLLGHLLTMYSNGGSLQYNATSKSINGTSVTIDIPKTLQGKDAVYWNSSSFGRQLTQLCSITVGLPMAITR